MREIKFRAWDKTNKKMLYENASSYVDSDLESVELETKLVVFHDSLYTLTRADWGMNSSEPEFVTHSFDLMQYTGLKDKYGMDVYEGDILRFPAQTTYEVTTYNSFEVFWHDNNATPTDAGLVLGRLTAHGNSAGGIGYKLVPENISRMIVIGNIYENHELLDGGVKVDE